MDKKELIDKLLKIKKLSEAGIDGEKAAATRLVESLMKKHGITEEELTGEYEPTMTWFSHSSKDPWGRKLLAQVIYSIVGNKDIYGTKNKARLSVECTKAEAVEIEAKYAFYKNALAEDMKIMYSAFLHTNNLFPPKSKRQDVPEEDDKQEREEADVDKILAMMDVLDRREYHRQISAAEE